MTIYKFGLEWDSISIAKKIKQAFIERKLTDKKNIPLGESMIFGMSDKGETAFIVEGFDIKNKFGIVITLPSNWGKTSNKKEIHIIGGLFTDDASLDAKYNKRFSDLAEASRYFETILSEYDTEILK